MGNNIFKKTKGTVLLAIGAFFALGAIVMVTEDIGGTIFFGFVGITCVICGLDILGKKQPEKTKDEVIETDEKFENNEVIEEDEELENIERKYKNEIRRQELELQYQKELMEIEEAKRKFKIIKISETEIEVTINKIQELYQENGFNVKVIDIRKNKYSTEYELIFSPSETNKYEIFNISDKIINEFDIDGVRIKDYKNKNNRIYVEIPLKYEKE